MDMFGRWVYQNGRSIFVAGTPPVPAKGPLPKLVLFSWQEFVKHGKDVRVAM
jgi:hypothetical protein